MKLDFDVGGVTVTEFGVGRENKDAQTFAAVPVGADVQTALREMARATWAAMQAHDTDPALYEPSEKHASTEYLYIPFQNDLAASIRDLHTAANLDLQPNALVEPTSVFSYFARFTDKKGRHLTALRRATQFKSILKSRNRLVRWVDNTLTIIEDDVFKLDNDFDLLADGTNVHILRPSGFEFAGRLQQAILDAVPENIKAIRGHLSFVNFDAIEEYARRHPRAARYLASIRAQDGSKNIDKASLKRACKMTGVDIAEAKGKLLVSAGSELGFLEVLDRRRFEIELVKGDSERFKAASRTRIVS